MTTVLEGVSVLPMDSERVLEDHTVIVDGDRITWVGPQAQAQVPATATRIDGRGKYLMPGLTDMHCHPGTEDDLLLFVTFGVTTIRNMDGLPRHVLWRDRIAAGDDLLSPTISTTGPIIEGHPCRYNGMQSVQNKGDAVAAVALTERGGYDAIKIYDQLTIEAYAWVLDSAKDRGLPVVGHIPFRVGLHRALASRQRSIEHLYGYLQAIQRIGSESSPHNIPSLRTWLLELSQHADTGRIAELAEATLDAQTWNCPTLIVRTRWALDPGEALARPEMSYLSPLRMAMARSFMGQYPTSPARQALIDINAAVVRGLSEAGAGLLIGTDAGLPGVVFGASVHEELKAFVAAGLTPFRALQAATFAAADFMGEAGDWGVVAPGARADLLLLDANPLDDVTHASRLAGVMLRGRWLGESHLAELLEDLAARQQALTNGPTALSMPEQEQTSAASERLLFDVSCDGLHLGAEQVAAEPALSGRRRIVSSARLIGGLGASEAADAGAYRSSVTIDESDIDRSAWFELETDDGLLRVESTRTESGHVVVTQQRATDSPPDVAFDDPDARALLAPPTTALYVRLAERLAVLEVGDELDVAVIGPALPPDPTVRTATVHAVRLPTTDAERDDRTYLVEYRRSNWTTGSVLTCDRSNRPVRLEHAPDLDYWMSDAPTAELRDRITVTRASAAKRQSIHG